MSLATTSARRARNSIAPSAAVKVCRKVAVVRLRALLAAELPDELRRGATSKLGEALIAAGEAEEGLKVLADPAAPRANVDEVPPGAGVRAARPLG
jgi:hypothetical protein